MANVSIHTTTKISFGSLAIHKLKKWVRIRLARHHASGSIGRLSDRDLRDIGMTRHDLDTLLREPSGREWETRRPLSTTREERARNW